MRKREYHGLLVVDKPGGVTSRAVVNRVQSWFPGGTRIGHTGTLDPLATGVLVICVGNATRLADYVQRMKKTYVAELTLGATSDTDDADGTITESQSDRPPVEVGVVQQCVEGFVGEIDQTPPAFSAAKIDGQRAYRLARRGQEVALEPRRVRIYSIDLLRYEHPALQIRVDCGKGTYIRSLARDIGERIGVGAFVKALRRTHVGHFDEKTALSLDSDALSARSTLLPIEAALAELPRIVLPDDLASKLSQGQAVPFADPNLTQSIDEFAVFDQQNALVGVARSKDQGLLSPVKILRLP
jgi:tRNA pseudouridine55 synthase